MVGGAHCRHSGAKETGRRGLSDISSKAAEKSGKPRRASSKTRPTETGVGNALRTVYEAAVREAVPQEMLDLLGKLD